MPLTSLPLTLRVDSRVHAAHWHTRADHAPLARISTQVSPAFGIALAVLEPGSLVEDSGWATFRYLSSPFYGPFFALTAGFWT